MAKCLGFQGEWYKNEYTFVTHYHCSFYWNILLWHDYSFNHSIHISEINTRENKFCVSKLDLETPSCLKRIIDLKQYFRISSPLYITELAHLIYKIKIVLKKCEHYIYFPWSEEGKDIVFYTCGKWLSAKFHSWYIWKLHPPSPWSFVRSTSC